MQISLNLPDNLSQTETFHQRGQFREIAVAFFQQEAKDKLELFSDFFRESQPPLQ